MNLNLRLKFGQGAAFISSSPMVFRAFSQSALKTQKK